MGANDALSAPAPRAAAARNTPRSNDLIYPRGLMIFISFCLFRVSQVKSSGFISFPKGGPINYSKQYPVPWGTFTTNLSQTNLRRRRGVWPIY